MSERIENRVGTAILMGGKNSRMNGTVKGLLKIKNITFLEQIQSILNSYSEVYLSINDKFSYIQQKQFEDMGFILVKDVYQEIGPMGGIYSLLSQSNEQYLFITACDMPFITEEYVKLLCDNIDDNTDIVVCYDKKGRLYPLAAIYSKSILPIVLDMINKGDYKLSKLIEKCRTKKICIEDSKINLEIFYNINTQNEYKKVVIENKKY